jgi:hypothetical protein
LKWRNFTVGDNIIIRHPSTDRWLAAVDYGATHGDVDWLPGEIDMYFNRFITQIEGNKIKVDASQKKSYLIHLLN